MLDLTNHKTPTQLEFYQNEERWLGFAGKTFARAFSDAYTKFHNRNLWKRYLHLFELVSELHDRSINKEAFIGQLKDMFKGFVHAQNVNVFLTYKDYMARVDFTLDRRIVLKEMRLHDSVAGFVARCGRPVVLNRQSDWGDLRHNPMIDVELPDHLALNCWPLLCEGRTSVIVQWSSTPTVANIKLEGDTDLEVQEDKLMISEFLRSVNPFFERWWSFNSRKTKSINDRFARMFRQMLNQNEERRLAKANRVLSEGIRQWRANKANPDYKAPPKTRKPWGYGVVEVIHDVEEQYLWPDHFAESSAPAEDLETLNAEEEAFKRQAAEAADQRAKDQAIKDKAEKDAFEAERKRIVLAQREADMKKQGTMKS